MDRTRAAVAALALTAVVGLVLTPSRAEADLSSQSAATQSQLAKVKAELTSNLTSDAQVEALSNRLQAALVAQQARVDDARFAQTQAAMQVAEADRELADLASRTEAERHRLVATAVRDYVDPANFSAGGVVGALSSDLQEAGVRQAYLSATGATIQDQIDAYLHDRARVQAARVVLVAKRDQAAAATRAAEAEAARLSDAAAAQTAAHAALQSRIADLRSESATLGAQQASIETLIRQRQAADAAAAAAALQDSGRGSGSAVSRSSIRGTFGLIWPIHGVVTSEYGPRWGGFHPGIDIAAAYGTPIAASKAGVVIYAGPDGGYGNFVCIDHGGGVSTCYAHQSQIAVTQGESVSQGQTIGYEGSTGDSTGPHVHFEVRINGSTENPRYYVPGDP